MDRPSKSFHAGEFVCNAVLARHSRSISMNSSCLACSESHLSDSIIGFPRNTTIDAVSRAKRPEMTSKARKVGKVMSALRGASCDVKRADVSLLLGLQSLCNCVLLAGDQAKNALVAFAVEKQQLPNAVWSLFLSISLSLSLPPSLSQLDAGSGPPPKPP